MNTLKFVSYDGEYPNLCSGTLILSYGKKQYIFPSGSLYSGGYCCYNQDTREIEQGTGPWEIVNFPKEFPPFLRKEAEELVNENIPDGCCGGCS